MDSATTLAETFFVAANRVIAGGKQSASAALREACGIVHGPYSDLGRQLLHEARWLHRQLYGDWDSLQYYRGGFTAGRWLTDVDRTALVLSLLFCYEYVVSEMLGDRTKLEEFVTQYNAIQERAFEDTQQLLRSVI
jgi:hypothetical protein